MIGKLIAVRSMPSPNVEVSRSRTVIGRLAGTVLVQRAVGPLEHPPVGEFGQPRIHRVIQPQPAFVEQDHHRCDRERLGRRGHPEDRVPAHWRATVMTHRPDRFDVRLLAPADQSDQPGNLPGLDRPRQHLTQSAQPRLGEAAVALSHHKSPCIHCSILRGLPRLGAHGFDEPGTGAAMAEPLMAAVIVDRSDTGPSPS
jgi:hypothetical protein